MASSANIASIETFPLNYPTVGWFKFFEGVKGRPSGRPAVLVKITDDNGTVGWGQSVPAHRWSYETMETVTDRCEDVANVIEGIILKMA